MYINFIYLRTYFVLSDLEHLKQIRISSRIQMMYNSEKDRIWREINHKDETQKVFKELQPFKYLTADSFAGESPSRVQEAEESTSRKIPNTAGRKKENLK